MGPRKSDFYLEEKDKVPHGSPEAVGPQVENG